MKKELKNIADHLDRDIITEQEARTLLLGLLGVSDSALVIDEIKDKHPFEKWDNGAPMYICPKCKEVEIGHGDNNCSNCGQKLEWHYH
jgi:ribosomal protein S24E